MDIQWHVHTLHVWRNATRPKLDKARGNDRFVRTPHNNCLVCSLNVLASCQLACRKNFAPRSMSAAMEEVITYNHVLIGYLSFSPLAFVRALCLCPSTARAVLLY
eukprot:5930574-Amphidinium_carterae.1